MMDTFVAVLMEDEMVVLKVVKVLPKVVEKVAKMEALSADYLDQLELMMVDRKDF